MIRRWRQALHKYDPPQLADQLQAAEEKLSATAPTPVSESKAGTSAGSNEMDQDPELADLDPSNQSTSHAAPSIFDAFRDDEDVVDFEEDDDLL
jgi:hypothetical protein